MSPTRDHAERLSYEITYAQAPGSDPGNPAFNIFREILKQDGKLIFDRDNQSASRLPGAAKFVASDCGVLAAVRRAEFDGVQDQLPLVAGCAKQIGQFNKFRLSPGELSYPSRLPDLDGEIPRLGYLGEGLAACLYYMHETQAPELEQIAEEVRHVLPNFEGFDFNVVGVDKVVFSMRFRDERGSVNAARMSHGNLIFLGLMVLTYSPQRPPVMLVEEPENGLTPAALKRFYAAIRALAFNGDESKRSQIMISSHSPYVICEAWNGEDRNFIHQLKTEDGQCVARRLSDAISEHGVVLAKGQNGTRDYLSLKNAEQLMCGYYA